MKNIVGDFFKKFSSFFLIAGITVAFAPFSGCDSLRFDNAIEEGTITYEVSYPYYEGFMAGILPDEMQMQFKDNKYWSELASGSYFRTSFNTNCTEKTLVHELKFMNEQFVSNIDGDGIDEMMDRFPSFTIIKTTETDSIAGYLCHKAIGVFDSPRLRDMNIYYTTEIDISDFNWCNQFKEIDGVLLAYEIEQFGLRTRFKAISVSSEKLEGDPFKPSTDYTEISGAEMHLKMQGIFNDVLH